MTRSMLHGAIAFVALCVAAPAPAAIFCATNALELSTALNDAAGNGEDDVIRVQTGTYDGGGIHDFDYAPAEFETGDVGTSLVLIGGFSPFGGNPCGQILVEDPLLTILDGGGVRRALKLHVREDSDITVRLLTFMNGTPGDDPFFFGGGLYYHVVGGGNGSITIERNAFLANEAHSGGGLAVYQAQAMVRVINNLFLANNADACGAANIRKLDGTSLLDAGYIANNTVIGNTRASTAIGGGGGICAHVEDTDMHVYNNNLWDNDLNDLYLSGNGEFILRNNNFEVRDGVEPALDHENISVEPVYESGLFNFTPARTSPLVDAGLDGPNNGASTWYLTDLDLRAQARVVGPEVDIGAYENERIFTNGFEVPGPFDVGRIETLCERLGCGTAAHR